MDIRSVNLNLLVALDALLTERAVTAAARRAGLSQPAMSHSLAQLRVLFDDPLLLRGGLLTPLGEALRERVRGGLAELQQVLDTRQSFDPLRASRRFRIGVSDLFQITSLPRLLALLAARAPHVDLVIRPPSAATLASLSAGEVDVLVGSAEQMPAGPLRTRRLHRERFVCLARRGHPHIASRLGLATYARLHHVLVAQDEEPGYIDRALAKRGRSRRVAVRLPDFAGLGHTVASSDLIATIPERLAQRLAESLPVQAHSVPLALPAFPVLAAWHPRWDADPAHRFLRAQLDELATD